MEKSPEKEDILTSKPLNHEELKAAIAQESTMVAIKSEPERRKSYQELSKLGTYITTFFTTFRKKKKKSETSTT